MRRNWQSFVLLALSLCCIGIATAGPKDPGGAAANTSAASSAAQGKPPRVNPGQRVFQANCGRCHNAPEELSPREARAVLRQMRVRANLSAEDEQLLLKFLAP